MMSLALKSAAGRGRGGLALAAVLAFLIAVFGNVGFASRADAAVTPFWEKSDNARKSAVQKKRYGKRSYRQRATAKRSAKRRYGTSRKARTASGKRRSYRTAKRTTSGAKKRSYSSYSPSKSLTGGSVRWVASSGCLAGQLKSVVYQVASKFGPVTVNSTCRSASRNRAVGGAKRSKHLSGQAVDFRVRGNVSAVYAYLKSSGSVGGLKHYGGGLFHIDTGPRRSW